MKKVLFTAVAVLGLSFANAQDIRFGVKGGLDIATIKVKIPSFSFLGEDVTSSQTVSASETGFFVGGYAVIPVSEKFSLVPEVSYVAIDNASLLHVPIMAKISFADKFSGLIGPSLNYLLDAEEDQLKFNVDAGAMYDITEDLDVSAKYSLGFGDFSVSGVYLGVGYKF
jgi:opacity protein-like surface antigen